MVLAQGSERWEGAVNPSTAPWSRAPLPPLPGSCAAAMGAKRGEDDGVATEFICAASATQTESYSTYPLSITI